MQRLSFWIKVPCSRKKERLRFLRALPQYSICGVYLTSFHWTYGSHWQLHSPSVTVQRWVLLGFIAYEQWGIIQAIGNILELKSTIIIIIIILPIFPLLLFFLTTLRFIICHWFLVAHWEYVCTGLPNCNNVISEHDSCHYYSWRYIFLFLFWFKAKKKNKQTNKGNTKTLGLLDRLPSRGKWKILDQKENSAKTAEFPPPLAS